MTNPDPGGASDLLTRLLDALQRRKASAQQAVAGMAAYAGTAIPDGITDVVSRMDPYDLGASSSIGAIAITAIAQGGNAIRERRRLCVRVLRDPASFQRVLLNHGREDLAGALLSLLDLYNIGAIGRRKLGLRLQEIMSDLMGTPEPQPAGKELLPAQ